MTKTIVPAMLLLVTTTALANPVPVLQATRATSAPTIDGRLDDACWKQTKPTTYFRRQGSQEEAEPTTTGHIAFDDGNLYIAIRGDHPDPKSILANAEEESDVFGDDSIEVFIRPRESSAFFQFAVSASGALYDGLRFMSGTSDGEWSSDARAASAIGADHWSMELAIPFHSLELTPQVTSEWQINLCRNYKRPHMYAAIGRDGLYLEPHKYARVQGIDVDFGRFAARVGAPQLVATSAGDEVSASATVSIENAANTARRFKVELLGSEPHRGQTLSLAAGASRLIELGTVSVAPRGDDGVTWDVTDRGPVHAVAVSDLYSSEKLVVSNLRYPRELRLLDIDLLDADLSAPGTGIDVILTSALADTARKQAHLELTVSPQGAPGVVATRRTPAADRVTRVTLDCSKLPTGRLRIQAALLGVDEEPVARIETSYINLAPRASAGKVLNNLVTELLDVDAPKGGSHTFTLARTGWVFFSAEGAKDAELDVDGSPVALSTSEPYGGDGREAMRWLAVGEHVVTVPAGLQRLIVRAIPELFLFRFPASRQLPQQHILFDEWKDLKRHVLHSYNTIMAAGVIGRDPRRTEDSWLLEEWRDDGRRWFFGGLVPAYHLPPDMTAQDAYDYWRPSATYHDPIWNGIIIDEFGVGDYPSHTYHPMAEAVRMLRRDFPDKLFYPFCLSMAGHADVKPFMAAVVDGDGPMVWEWYEREEPDFDAARHKLSGALKAGMDGWRGFFPDATPHMMICLGYYSTPPMSLNENPAVDYKVWKDMQIHMLATDPSFDGLYGLMEWNTKYADEETVRWVARLYRHYAIEGKTNLLSEELGYRYNPGHLQNPDFDDGTIGWTVTAAEEDSVGTGNIPGLGILQGRVRGSSRGNNFVWMRRSDEAPNRVTQELRNLTPGTLYSMKLTTADHRHYLEGIVEKQTHAVRIEIDGVEMIPDIGWQQVMESSRGQEVAPFARDRQPWFNHYWRLFRATQPTAKLTVSDWSTPNDPGGPVGQELLYNFVEVQPYFEAK